MGKGIRQTLTGVRETHTLTGEIEKEGKWINTWEREGGGETCINRRQREKQKILFRETFKQWTCLWFFSPLINLDLWPLKKIFKHIFLRVMWASFHHMSGRTSLTLCLLQVQASGTERLCDRRVRDLSGSVVHGSELRQTNFQTNTC